MKSIALIRVLTWQQIRDLSYSFWVFILPALCYATLRFFFPAFAAGHRALILAAFLVLLTAPLMNLPLHWAQMRQDGLLKRFALTAPGTTPVLFSSVLSNGLQCAFAILALGVMALLSGESGLLACLPVLALAWLGTVSLGVLCAVSVRDFMTLKNLGNFFMLTFLIPSGLFFTIPIPAVQNLNPFWQLRECLLLNLGGGRTQNPVLLVILLLPLIAGVIVYAKKENLHAF